MTGTSSAPGRSSSDRSGSRRSCSRRTRRPPSLRGSRSTTSSVRRSARTTGSRTPPGSRRGTQRSPGVRAPICAWAWRSVAIETDGDAVTAVRTVEGSIATPTVVNAAGPWAGTLAATAGVSASAGTHPADGRDDGSVPGRSGAAHARDRCGDHLLLPQGGRRRAHGHGWSRRTPVVRTNVDLRFIEEELLPTAMRVFPPIEHAGLARMWAGLYEMTPDRHPIIGESPVRGLFLANGFSGHGFQHAPVVGKLIAELIVEGEARTVDISSLGLDRFDARRPRRGRTCRVSAGRGGRTLTGRSPRDFESRASASSAIPARP